MISNTVLPTATFHKIEFANSINVCMGPFRVCPSLEQRVKNPETLSEHRDHTKTGVIKVYVVLSNSD